MPRGEKDDRKSQKNPEINEEVGKLIDHTPEDPEIAKDASPDDFE